MVLHDNPLCVDCQAQGFARAATDVDHIIAKRFGGTDEMDNLQPLCHECHSRKTNREMGSMGERAPVTMVCGPPGAGKTTYVRRHRGVNDIVVDLDAIAAALTLNSVYEKTSQQLGIALDVRNYLLARMAQGADVRRWWLITSEADPDKRRTLGLRVNAEQVVVLAVDALECKRRIYSDGRAQPSQWAAIIDQWWSEYRPVDGETVVQNDANHAKP